MINRDKRAEINDVERTTAICREISRVGYVVTNRCGQVRQLYTELREMNYGTQNGPR